ncbi:hypothetical protein [Halomonas sp. BC04]|uniref:hypothetical protein n=1 Tax=Halomonas sp. BC04 TaxID=1403540 RepID=UPI003FA54344
MLLGWAWIRKLPLAISAEEWPWLMIAGLFTILGFNVGTAFGQLHMPTSQAAIIAFTMPCWALLMASASSASASPGGSGWASLWARRAC